MPRIRLLARCQINDRLHEVGDVVFLAEGQRGPHRTAVASNHGAQIAGNRYIGDKEPDANYGLQDIFDEPLYVVLDEGIEQEREAMRVRHAEERAKFDRAPERDDLAAKQAREMADIDLKAQESELKARQQRERDTLERRQSGEAKAFDKRAESTAPMPAPAETDKDTLETRHKVEQDHQQRRHDEETRQIEERKSLRQDNEVTDPQAAPAATEPKLLEAPHDENETQQEKPQDHPVQDNVNQETVI